MRTRTILPAAFVFFGLMGFALAADAACPGPSCSSIGAFAGKTQNTSDMGDFGEDWGGVKCTATGGCNGIYWEVSLPVTSNTTAAYAPEVYFTNVNSGDIKCAVDVINNFGTDLYASGMVDSSGLGGANGDYIQPTGATGEDVSDLMYMFVACNLPDDGDLISGIYW